MVGTVATGLQAPWGLTFLPDGTALVGERDTTRVLAIDGRRVRPVGRVGGVQPQGEAGLLGLATSPTYAADRLVYAYLSTARDNRVVTMRYDGRRLGPPTPVLTGIPNGFVHDGGRLLFAPDGNLFVSTGETGDPAGPGPLVARRQDPADHPRGRARPRQPGAGLPRLDDGPPQRAGPGLRRRGAAVGHRVRPGHLGRAQPDRPGPQLRLAAGGGPRRPAGVPQPVRAVAHRRRVPLRPRLPRRLAVGRRPAGRAAVAGAPRPRPHRHPAGLLRRRLRTAADRGRRSRREPLGDHQQPGHPGHAEAGDDRILVVAPR